MHAPRPSLAPLRASKRPEIFYYGRRRAFNAPTLSCQKRLLAKDGTAKKSPPPGTPDAGAATPRRGMALGTLVDFCGPASAIACTASATHHSRAPPGGACSRPASRPPHELGGKDSNSGQCDVHVVHRAAVRAMSRQALIAQVGHGEELEEEAVRRSTFWCIQLAYRTAAWH